MSSQYEPLIQQAIADARAGNKPAARAALLKVVRQDSGNARAWYLLSQVVEKPEQVKYCLEQVLKIQPDNAQAKERLNRLDFRTTQNFAEPTKRKKKSRLWQIRALIMLGVSGVCCICIVFGLSALGSFPTWTPTNVLSQIQPIVNLTGTPKPTDTTAPSFATTNAPLPTLVNYPTITHTWIPSLTPITTSFSSFGIAPICISPNAVIEVGTVTNVVDGDTIDVVIDGKPYRVRYIGMDSPETNQYFGPEATAKNRELVEGKSILLVKDVSETDQYGRLLRYVFVDSLGGVFVNYELIKQGYAHAASFPPDVACTEYFRQAEQSAILAARGLWVPTPVPSLTPIVRIPNFVGGQVVITSIFYNGMKGDKEPDEYVEIRNNDSKPIQLQNWTLSDKANHVFTFPSFVIQPGQVCRIYTNENHQESCGFSFNSGKSAIWNNNGDCAYLRDNQGNLIAEYCY